MVGGIFYEHGHRLIASAVGMLTIGLVVFLWRVERRAWVRRLGWIALAAVIAQGLLGGLTVIYLLPDAISISHAGLAQIFFCLTVTIALVTSRSWLEGTDAPDDPSLRRQLIAMTALIYLQILVGATMRHTGAGLAIPDFPLAFGRVLPPVWTVEIAVHFAHRVGALVVTILVLANATHIWNRHGSHRELVRPSWLLVIAVATQVALGATVVLSGKHEIVNTLHVAVGSIVLGTALVLALRAGRSALSSKFEVRSSR
jgi:cytochrome c oxidase assembly protein subunit 15